MSTYTEPLILRPIIPGKKLECRRDALHFTPKYRRPRPEEGTVNQDKGGKLLLPVHAEGLFQDIQDHSEELFAV
jgi:hypothetical protein